ncbi:pyruvate dehydrogenase (acetyl-transferring) E1 component subunit alpha [Streptomyces tsukubensis]|uniref:Pyruvate dehydrogenase (Acetyl-transferring) E1 component subunit alpha n=1 Tax=Streptomyces tsukubensis TaxID=83656 RepID=A0A1V4A2I6_9ACTN|nr:pyruvate dehydrogenase (acetyl-transferring) E1 component subunit alpha [Streptomyces tsukubensis]OON72904.1 pyruvate dehydrogenase (acetyl-transferring) E1 component subunit alpha [Streptomyces tsukubensis]QFR94494.1 pyruvate dehydrogenase (acetyl-transferring) E1 component subunit alpha [Streptomyces tsukubensis]
MTVESTTARTPRGASTERGSAAGDGAPAKKAPASKAPGKKTAVAKSAGPAGKKAAGPAAKKSAGPAAKKTAPKTAAKKTAAKKAPARTSAAGSPRPTAHAEAPASAAEGGQLIQLLTPEGERISDPAYDAYVDAITPEELRGLYRDMLLTRRFDAEATALQRQGELGLWASLLGQEAAQIGSGRALRDDDYVFPTYREHGVAWCRGVDPANLLGMFRGVNHGGWDPNSNNFHLYTIVIGSQTLHATGYAMGVAKDGADSAVIAYFGDGASSQGDVAEAFTFSAVYNAPVVFFCQNNQWAISEPTEKQTRVPLYQRARGFGFPGVRVDGNDVLACLAVTRAALEHARNGEGPMLVEAFTYRMGAHTTSDDPTKYRADEEREAWEAKDPLLRLRSYLLAEGFADESFFGELETESEALGKRVREVVRSMPEPDRLAIFENVYADGHALVDEERAQFRAYQASFADAPASGEGE